MLWLNLAKGMGCAAVFSIAVCFAWGIVATYRARDPAIAMWANVFLAFVFAALGFLAMHYAWGS